MQTKQPSKREGVNFVLFTMSISIQICITIIILPFKKLFYLLYTIILYRALNISFLIYLIYILISLPLSLSSSSSLFLSIIFYLSLQKITTTGKKNNKIKNSHPDSTTPTHQPQLVLITYMYYKTETFDQYFTFFLELPHFYTLALL